MPTPSPTHSLWPFTDDESILKDNWGDGDDAGDETPGSTAEGPLSEWLNIMASAMYRLQQQFGSGGSMLNARVDTIEDVRELGGKGVIFFAVAGHPRPTSNKHASYEWIGPVQPTNALAGDTWVDDTP